MLLPKRVWKDIPGYEGVYQVSNTGQVRSLGNNKSRKTKILKQATNKHGYKLVQLYKNGKGKLYTVHKLVAQAFLENPNNLSEINHKDENKQNNCSWNLEYCTHEYNMNYGTIKERMSEAHKGKPKTEEHKKKQSEAMKGKKHWNYGKHHTEETISKRRQREEQIQQLIQLTLDIYNKCNKDCKLK